jgi:hypothetical protein
LELLPAGIVDFEPKVDAECSQGGVGGHVEMDDPLQLPATFRRLAKRATADQVGARGVADVGREGVGPQVGGEGEKCPASP